ncbi:hypothetical protein I7I53_03664 [Histoplasma capsulatum var. duboisii H88]|uniref:Uncharacterized protein n=1 Tax=Ajellomyces capsulatus (strain H88) TaxID=544711 RepID=A0A8A1LUE2_AJEC8|nr:hypothetical protein I7I53_03664 [Histoplasma capsulatum var. duboisii H88]
MLGDRTEQWIVLSGNLPTLQHCRRCFLYWRPVQSKWVPCLDPLAGQIPFSLYLFHLSGRFSVLVTTRCNQHS